MKRVCFLGGPSLEGGHRRGQEHPGQRYPRAQGHMFRVTCSPWGGIGGVLRSPLTERETSKVLFQGPGETYRIAQPAVPTAQLTSPTSPEHQVLATSCLPDGHLAFSSEVNSTCSTFARCDPPNRRWDGLCSSWENSRKPGPQGPQGQSSQRWRRPEFRTSQSTSRKMCFLETLTWVNKPTSLCLS